ncbi:hypothetical protein PR202_ga06034 [Eleusine coracana subsp. coracana]|uniref:Phospholipase A1 n=1 Tax=Eleusine coracana subsp. coracana TaxID=191504 RepID=A0AAV5BW70_ELECO|nr:hypothetical protein PR202_ga06034 [Eleusine coracana subsp. coracana]
MSSSSMLGSIAERWRELHGADSWKGLLDPLDMDLRKYLISYGELTQATYDGFNQEKRSPHAGACLYGRDDLLVSSCVAGAGNYSVTKFIYATSKLPMPEAFLLLPLPELPEAWSRESNWMGYVAVATDEGVAALGRRDIIVAWRGTMRNLEWVNDFDFTPVSAAPVLGPAAAKNPAALVHRGFLSVYTSTNADSKYTSSSARDQASTVLEEVRSLVEQYKDEEMSITIIGHSLGASLATLNAVDIAANGLNAAACPVTAFVFASPRVGDGNFKAALRSFPDLRVLHTKNAGDVVPVYPPIGYVDVAVALPITTMRSPFLRQPGTVKTLHSLECYLHGVAGEQGSAGGFNLEVDRDVALVNKEEDALKDKYPVPTEWRTAKNKFMVMGDDRHWTLQDFEEI